MPKETSYSYIEVDKRVDVRLSRQFCMVFSTGFNRAVPKLFQHYHMDKSQEPCAF